jgi:hypothetical protein
VDARARRLNPRREARPPSARSRARDGSGRILRGRLAFRAVRTPRAVVPVPGPPRPGRHVTDAPGNPMGAYGRRSGIGPTVAPSRLSAR